MSGLMHPGFELVGASLPMAKGGVIDVAAEGASGVIGALLAAEAGDDAWLMRDASALPSQQPRGGSVWLQTSGTTGTPKWVAYDIARLAARISRNATERACWLLTYNPGAFAGVQVLLSAMIGGHALVAPDYGASVADMARRAAVTGVTHISATPTFWRAFLMALGDNALDLKGVTLGGEAADQPLLDALRARFPNAVLRHIYATTEAGTLFSVSDGRAGFPRAWLGEAMNGLILGVSERDTLQVRNSRASDVACGDVWDTGDVVELTDNRVLFKGRADAMVNIGGVKVYPESVETHILALPFVQDVNVTARPNPITGHILTADILLKPFAGDSGRDYPAEIRQHMAELPRAFRPASLRFVDALDIGATGKKQRRM